MFDTVIDPSANHGVGIVFTDRLDGTESSPSSALPFAGFNLGRSDIVDRELFGANLARLGEATGVQQLVMMSQVHGTDVVVVNETMLDDGVVDLRAGQVRIPESLPVADAVVTSLADVGLVVRVADCAPVLLADQTGVVGAAHAGREGLLNGVLTATVTTMRELGATRITAWIGPHICGECYELPADMVDRARRTHPQAVSVTRQGTPSIDLGAGCAGELADLEVQVIRVDPCTMENSHLYSHRRELGNAGRQVGMIWRNSRVADRIYG